MSYFRNTYFPTCDNPITGIETLLKLIYVELGKQNAIDGMTILSGAGAVYSDTEFYGFIPRENTIVDQLEVDDEYVQDDYGLTGVTLTTDDPAIMAPRDEPFTRIKLTSGGVWILIKAL